MVNGETQRSVCPREMYDILMNDNKLLSERLKLFWYPVIIKRLNNIIDKFRQVIVVDLNDVGMMVESEV